MMWVYQFWTTEPHNPPRWNAVWPQDQQKSFLSLQFHFCPFLQMKKTTFVDEITVQILQSSLCFCWSHCKSDSCSNEFQYGGYMNIPPLLKELAKTVMHFTQACFRHQVATAFRHEWLGLILKCWVFLQITNPSSTGSEQLLQYFPVQVQYAKRCPGLYAFNNILYL